MLSPRIVRVRQYPLRLQSSSSSSSSSCSSFRSIRTCTMNNSQKTRWKNDFVSFLDISTFSSLPLSALQFSSRNHVNFSNAIRSISSLYSLPSLNCVKEEEDDDVDNNNNNNNNNKDLYLSHYRRHYHFHQNHPCLYSSTSSSIVSSTRNKMNNGFSSLLFSQQCEQYQYQQERYFSSPTNRNNNNNNNSRRSNKRGNNNNNSSSGGMPLSNENLITVLMKGKSSPDNVTVRIVIDEKSGNKDNNKNNGEDDDDDDSDNDDGSDNDSDNDNDNDSDGDSDKKDKKKKSKNTTSSSSNNNTVAIVSLAKAIEISVDRNLDLIAATLDSNPPVIRCTKLSKLLFHKEQAQQQQQLNAKKNKKLSKSFRFKAGIGDHDLERKVNDMKKSLQSGMECDFIIFTKAFLLRQDPNAGNELSEKIQQAVSEFGTLKRQPQINETGNQIRCVLEPKQQQQQ